MMMIAGLFVFFWGRDGGNDGGNGGSYLDLDSDVKLFFQYCCKCRHIFLHFSICE